MKMIHTWADIKTAQLPTFMIDYKKDGVTVFFGPLPNDKVLVRVRPWSSDAGKTRSIITVGEYKREDIDPDVILEKVSAILANITVEEMPEHYLIRLYNVNVLDERGNLLDNVRYVEQSEKTKCPEWKTYSGPRHTFDVTGKYLHTEEI
jgi:hypothetical protein